MLSCNNLVINTSLPTINEVIPIVYFCRINYNTMSNIDKQHERIANMTFASVYPHYLTKVKKKGRTMEELHEIIKWLTGFDENKLKSLIDEEVSFQIFFDQLP